MNTKTKRPKKVTKPVLEFKTAQGRTIRLWVYDAGQFIHFDGFLRNGLTFGNEKTGGLVYEESGADVGHLVTEYDLDNESTWEWIAKWMVKGMQAENILAHIKVAPEPESIAKDGQ